MEGPIVVSVVVPSHGRPLRLRWLLHALEEQTLAADRWELLVVHDYDRATTERVIGAHPLARDGRLREVPIEPGTGNPARQRNIGWQNARGEHIAFTDDDCRPEPEWLERLVAAVREHPGVAVVQGRTRPDPLERELLRGPHVRTLKVDPVGPWAQTANMLYPRRLLEQLDGFDEGFVDAAGEDVDLWMRARAAGAEILAAPDAVVNHAVESHTLPGIVRKNLKWRHLAYLVKRHPEVRAEFPLRIFWDSDHLLTSAALAGIVGATRNRALLVLAAPYVRRSLARRGHGPKARATAAVELPGQAARQAAEVAGLLVGSVRHRTPVL